MELIINILTEYLKHNKRLVVPKLGVFIVKPQSETIVFSELMRNDDNILRSLLIAYGVKELEATGAIDRFVFEIRHTISSGEKYTIDGFGEFSQGENNTIIFKQKREPQHIGGNIKPPIETLNAEKRRLKRHSDIDSTGAKRPESATSNKRNGGRAKTSVVSDDEIDITTLGKPDKYLRGLKYDNNKNKKRGEEGRRNDGKAGRKSVRFLLSIIVICIIGFGTWYAWQWLSVAKQPAYDTTTSARMTTEVEEAICDTLNIVETDSLIVATPGESVEIGTPSSTPTLDGSTL